MPEVEIDERLAANAARENRPFKRKNGWMKRQPRCPDCDSILKATRKSIRVSNFRETEWETCLKEGCKPEDHHIRTKSKVFRCSSCKNDTLYAAHPAEMTIHIRCKCELEPEEQEQWNAMAAQVHMMQIHGLDKHAYVQYQYDSMRPIPLVVKTGQKVLVIGPPMPTGA